MGAFFKPTKDISGRRETSVSDQFPSSGGNLVAAVELFRIMVG